MDTYYNLGTISNIIIMNTQAWAELCQAQIKLGLADHLARWLASLLPGKHLTYNKPYVFKTFKLKENHYKGAKFEPNGTVKNHFQVGVLCFSGYLYVGVMMWG